MKPGLPLTRLMLITTLPWFAGPAPAADESPEARALVDRVFSLAERYFSEFQHPETGVLYGGRLATRSSWTSPEEVMAEKPHPWGYGSRIADTALHTGHMLAALIEAREARPDPFLEAQIRRHFEALKLIGSLPETYPKPGKPALEGLVPRGPHPDDPAAYYDDSSMDQHTTYIIALARYADSDLALEADRRWIRESLGKVGRRLERHRWSIRRADGETEAHVGFSWLGFNSNHVSILLPTVLALHRGTGDASWAERYESFLEENDGRRWQLAHPGPQVEINGHPIYANQNAFRTRAWLRFEKDPERKKVIRGLLEQSTRMQLDREFPGEFYRRYHPEAQWHRMQTQFDWDDTGLHGALRAWEKFTPEMLDHEDRALAALAHVRFPLGGFHMALLSESPEFLREHLPAIREMLDRVDLDKIAAGETHYLFTVVALHLYARYFQSPEFFRSTATGEPGGFGPELPIVADAGTGPVIDVAVEGHLAFAIGQGSLRTLDISDPKNPRILGQLSGLGGVRQIEVRGPTAYVTSRQDGLFIIDVGDPAEPRLLSHFDTIEFATGVAISGDVLFVACRNYGVQLIDVSDPSLPAHLSLVRTGEAQSVVSRNGYLYAGVWATSEVVVVDVRDPRHPVITAKLPLDGYGDGVDVAGGHLYVATGHHSRETPRQAPGDPGFGRGHGLEVFEIADPARPQFVSRVKFPPLYEIGNDMWGVTVADGHAFVADTWNGMFVVDVTDPRQPEIVARRTLPFVEKHQRAGFVGGLALTDGHVLLAGGATDLHVIAAPDLAGSPRREPDRPAGLSLPDPTPDPAPEGWSLYRSSGQVHAAALLDDSTAVIACGSDGVHLVSLSPEIRLIATFPTGGFATDVAVSGSRVFVAESAGGLSIWEMSDGALERVGNYRIPGRAIRQVEVPAPGTRALVQAGANQFLILDVSDPAKPARLLEDTRHGLLYGDQLMRGLVDDRYAGVFWHVSGIHWYDLGATPVPQFSGDNFAERTGSANGLVAFGGKTLATVRGGYLLLDRSERRPLDQLTVHPIGELRSHPGVPSVSGNRLYTANRSTGLVTVTDLSDPTQPRLIEQFETAGNPGRIAVGGDGLVLIPDGYHGLLIRGR